MRENGMGGVREVETISCTERMSARRIAWGTMIRERVFGSGRRVLELMREGERAC